MWEFPFPISRSSSQYVCPAEQFFYWYAFVLLGLGMYSRGWNVEGADPRLTPYRRLVKTPFSILGYGYANAIDMMLSIGGLLLLSLFFLFFLSSNAILRCVIFTLRICPLFTWRHLVRVLLRLSLKLILWHTSYIFSILLYPVKVKIN